MIHKLQKQYPSLRFVSAEDVLDQSEIFSDQGRTFSIHKSELTENEVMLLKALYPFQQRSPWMGYLLDGDSYEVEETLYRVLQIKFTKLGNYDLWLDTFLSFFSNYEEVFSINEQHHVLILKDQDIAELEFSGILQTLDEDIGVSASLYIGDVYPLSEELVNSFDEDRNIFESIGKNTGVFDFQTSYIRHYIKEHLNKSAQLMILRGKIMSLKDGLQLVEVLWQCQGNITLAAQILFLHRNTLNYRLDKFEEITGLSLRSLKDLQLAYFSIL